MELNLLFSFSSSKTGLEMAMGILVLAVDTCLDALEPLVFQNLLDRDACLWVGVQDLLHQTPASKGQPLKGLVVADRPHIQKVLVIGVLGCRSSERDTLVDHAVVDNAAGPDVDTTGIVLLVQELFWCNVGLRSTEALGQVGRLFPAHAEHVRDTKVGDLEATLSVQQQVLGLDVTVGHAHGMQVGDTVNQLFEAAVDLDAGHVTLFDGVVEVSTTAVLLLS